MVPPPLVCTCGRKDTGQFLAGASPWGSLGALVLVLSGEQFQHPGHIQACVPRVGTRWSLWVVTGQKGEGADGSGLLLGGRPVPCTVRSSKASSPRCVPVSPIDILETLMSQAVAGLTSSSNSPR